MPPLMSRSILYMLTIAVSLFVGSLFPQISAPLRSLVDTTPGGKDSPGGKKMQAPTEAASDKGHEGHDHGKEGHEEHEAHIELTAAQIAAAKIDTAPAAAGALVRRISVPAAIEPDPDRVGRVAAKLAGTVAEMRKRLGDHVEKGEVVAVIDSREVADAKSEYLASLVQLNLQQVIFQREKGLFEKQIIAEQMFLRTKTTFAEARLKSEVARQKLASLDLSEAEIAALPKQPAAALRRKDIHAPIAGRVIERRVNLGQPIGGEGQEKELYVIADLSVAHAHLAVSTDDLAHIHEKQAVDVVAPDGRIIAGEIEFVSPMLNKDTRSARVMARFGNADFALRPGSLLTARIALKQTRVGVRVPRAAVLTMDGEQVVFVRNREGFERRDVTIGSSDDETIEIKSGLEPGDIIAVSNTFVLKSELGKSAGHGHQH